MKKKNSVAILITISFLLFFSVFASISLGKISEFLNYEKSKSDIIQLNYSLKNIEELLSKVPTSELDFLTTLPLHANYEKFNFILSFNNNENFLNINWYSDENKKKIIIKSLNNFFTEKNILYPDIFYNILDEIYSKKKGRNFINYENNKLSRGKIFNKEHFKYIMDNYYEITKDSNIFNSNIEDKFSYNNEGIYLNIIEKEYFNFLFPESDNYELFYESEDKKKFILDNITDSNFFIENIKINEKKEYYNGEMILIISDFKYNIKFLYNIKTRKIENITL